MKTITTLLLFTIIGIGFCQAQDYKIGDKHPNGFVFDIDPTGKYWVVMAGETKLNYTDAVNSKNFGPAYADFKLPNNKQLIAIYNNLAAKGIGNFKKELYRSSESSGYASYPNALNFANGKMETSALNNLTLTRGVKAYPNDKKQAVPAAQPVAAPAKNNVLTLGASLQKNAKLVSENNKYILKMQDDGNLCIYQMVNGKEHFRNENDQRLWCAGSQNATKNPVLQLKPDGSLVIIDAATKSEKMNFNTASLKPVKLVLENNGVLNLYNAAGKVVWTKSTDKF